MKCRSNTSNQPGDTSELPKRDETPPESVWLQNKSKEYPKAVVGMMKGMSASVSIALSQRLLPRVISHAIGMPASKSSAATISATMKLFWMAPNARLTSRGWLRMNWTSFHLMNMPAMGGTSMRAKKMTIADA